MTAAVAMPRVVTHRHSVDEWADTVRANIRGSVENIIAAGRNLVEAHDDLGRGEWLPLLKRVGIGERTAQRLMFIANNLRLANPTHVSHLPPCWGTLYELTKLAPDVLEAKIIEGMITPEITRAEVARLAKVARVKGSLERDRLKRVPHTALITSWEDLDKFLEIVRHNLQMGPPATPTPKTFTTTGPSAR